MSTKLHDISLSMTLTDGGDALLWGFKDGRDVSGDHFRKLLFTWHEPSLYGTLLETQQAGELTVTILPVDQVLSFFATPNFMDIVSWEMGTESAQMMMQIAPLLYEAAQKGHYIPSYEDFRNGKLIWTWDRSAEDLADIDWSSLERMDDLGEAGLRAAFSAAVVGAHYADDSAMADLRRDYPALFNTGRKQAVADDSPQLLPKMNGSLRWAGGLILHHSALPCNCLNLTNWKTNGDCVSSFRINMTARCSRRFVCMWMAQHPAHGRRIGRRMSSSVHLVG